MEENVMNNMMNANEMAEVTATAVTGASKQSSFDVKSGFIGFVAGVATCFVAGKIKKKRVEAIEAKKTPKTKPVQAEVVNDGDFEQVNDK